MASSEDPEALETLLRELTRELQKANTPTTTPHQICGCKGGDSEDDADFFYKGIGTVAALGASIKMSVSFGL